MPLINVPNVLIEQAVLEQALIDAGVVTPPPDPPPEPPQAVASSAAPAVTFRDVKAAADHGGAFASGSWRTRDLNVMSANSIGATLAGNQFTLPASSYTIRAIAPAYRVFRHKIRLFSITDNAAIGDESPTEYGSASEEITTKAELNLSFTITQPTVFEVQHICQTTKDTNGFGIASSTLGGDSVYTQVFVWKDA